MAKKSAEAVGEYVGKKIDEFTADAIIGSEEAKINLSDFSGKKVVLYFYPKDNTSGCTTEALGFEENLDELRKRGVEVVGISSDSLKSHKGFAQKKSLSFPLISDEDKTIHEKFDTWKLKKMCGREYMGTERSTFLIDENGVVIKEYRKVNTKTHAQDILDYIDSL